MSRELLSRMPKEDRIDLSVLTNLYYMFAEEMDQFIREAERIQRRNGIGFKQEVKQRHNRIMQQMEILKNLQEDFFRDYTQAWEGNWEKLDAMRESASLIGQVSLLVADILTDDESDKLRKMIMAYLEKKATHKYVSRTLMERMKFKL